MHMKIEHIYKQCTLCGHYFDGQLDGSYSCPECQIKEIPAAAPRSLTPLDDNLVLSSGIARATRAA